MIGLIIREEDCEKYKDAEEIQIDDEINFIVDLSLFSNITSLILPTRNFKNLKSLKNLTSLAIRGLKYKDIDLGINPLEYLSISYCDIETLDFLIEYRDIKEIKLNYLRNLKDISMLSNFSSSLLNLDIISCKNLHNIQSALKSLINLKGLTFMNLELETISWIKQLKNLKGLVIIESNIKDGDISPAKDIEYVAIDNKRHYNYHFNDKTRKIEPRTVNNNQRKTPTKTISLIHFGKINLDDLNETYEANMKSEFGDVSLDINFERNKIAKSKFKTTKVILDHDGPTILRDMFNILKHNLQNESLVMYKEYIEDEFEQAHPNIEAFIESLILKRIGFYPEDKNQNIIIDLNPKGLDLDHVLSIKINNEFQVTEIALEG